MQHTLTIKKTPNPTELFSLEKMNPKYEVAIPYLYSVRLTTVRECSFSKSKTEELKFLEKQRTLRSAFSQILPLWYFQHRSAATQYL